MGKRAYCDVLNLRLEDLAKQIGQLKLRWEYAGGLERFWYSWEIQSLERRQQALVGRLRELDRERDGLWGDIKADVRGVTDDLPGGVERWIERLDASYAARFAGRQTPRPREGHDRSISAPKRHRLAEPS